MTHSRRVELKFQNHIIDSYEKFGGYARKWASDLQVGPPDLVGAMPEIGQHLMEVKHRPEFGDTKMSMPNPMDKKQIDVAKRYINANGVVFLGVVGKSSKAIGSTLSLFDPLDPQIDYEEDWALPYVGGIGFMLNLNAFKRILSWQNSKKH